jgi:GH35 family endo-1,4-beta-xylanase
MRNVIKNIIRYFGLAAFAAGSAYGGSLTAAEVAQIEAALGITLSNNDITQLSAIVYPANTPSWRSDAYARIDAHRKAELDIRVVDQNGAPVEGAEVEVQLRSSSFKFGGILNLKDFTDEDSNLQITTNKYRNLFLALFNSAGLDNGLKPKQRASNEALLPGFIAWAQSNNVPVRGHNLIWPGTPGNNHLPDELPDTPASYSVLSKVAAVETALTNGSSQPVIDTLKSDLRSEINYMIGSWASKWPVYEWDVINEPISNYRVQELLGYPEMAEWFKVAETNAVDPSCRLLINDYQIISARSEALDPGHYTSRKAGYMTNINHVIDNGGRLDRIGFQSRFKFERPDPAAIYSRLQDFGNAYGLEMAGTEFEVVDTDPPDSTFFPYNYTEQERAQITEEVLTTYFSHPLVSGLNAWTYMKNVSNSMCYYDGTVKLNGLVWYYLHRIRYNTDAVLASGPDGRTGLRAFKGDYNINVRYKGRSYSSALVHTNNQQIVISLVSSVADSSPASTVIDAWSYDGLTNGAGLSSGISTGLTGGVFTPDHALASIQNETVRWQSDGATDSMYRNIVPSGSAGATNGIFQLSIDYLDADFSGSAAVTNGSGRVGLGLRSGTATDAAFRLIFSSGNKTNPVYRLEVTDAKGTNQAVGTFSGTALGHLNVRAVYDLNNRGSNGSFKVFYRLNGAGETAAYSSGKLPSGFSLDQIRLVVQTYNGGVNWIGGDRMFTDNLALRKLDAPLLMIIAVAGSGGAVYPTNANVIEGGSTNFVIAADPYYRIAALTTNGTAVTGLSFDNTSKIADFIWNNIRASGVLAATFTAQVVTNTPANVPYEWLAGHGLTNYNADADADQDSDGLRTWQEYIAGTAPTSAASCFKVARHGPDLISWNAVSGRVYSVFQSTNLLQGFTNVADNLMYPQSSYTNVLPGVRGNFYRIGVRKT